MTPSARLQAAIEILDAVVLAARDAGAAADTIVARYFRERRYAGSKDRRAVRDLVYDVIRSRGERPASGRAAMIGHVRDRAPDLLPLFGDGPHAPVVIAPDEEGATAGVAPGWLLKRLRTRFPAGFDAEVAAMLGRASLDVRVNRLKSDRDSIAAEYEGFSRSAHAPDGLRVDPSVDVEHHPAFLDGRIEVQDEGSQLVAVAAGAAPGMTVIDLCAGAGGKTLALAAAMRNEGRIIACDTDRNRLQRLAPRAERAGATIIETRLLDPKKELTALADLSGKADIVLIDAPCSGTGTWRRNPEARWRLTPDRIGRLTALQAHLLDLGALLVRPGGRIVYVVCSLLPEEGEAQMAAFHRRRAGFRPSPFTLPTGDVPTPEAVLNPRQFGCDGFFVAASTFI